MAVAELRITKREPYLDGRSFGNTSAYERIEGVLTYAVDPEDSANASIVDLALAPRGSDGLVRYQGNFCLLTPLDPDTGNGRVLIELPNRGRKLIPRHFNRAVVPGPPTAEIAPGDGFLFRHGYSVAWIGWQWDVFRSDALMGLEAPEALIDGQPVQGQAVVEIHPNELERTRLLANRLHVPNRVANLEDPDAALYVREWEDGPDTLIARDQWQFARREGDAIVPDDSHIYMESGFQPGKIYHVVYTAASAPVVGAGLLAARDVASFLKYESSEGNPLAGRAERAYLFGMSQSGRMQRHFLSLGLNLDEAGRVAYDGMLVHVAGGRRGEFNHRFGQPSVQSTPGFGHRFPFADEPQQDPHSGLTAGLLDRQREIGGVPRIFYINTSAEYWRGDGSLIHTDPTGEHDVEPAPEARIYLFAGTQHGPGAVPQTQVNPNDGGRGRYGFNTVDYTPLLRAALVNLDRWATEGAEPPESRYPHLSEGTAAQRSAVLRGFAEFPEMYLPDSERLPVLRTVDLGDRADHGIGAYPVKEGETYPAYVSATDEDGNEVAGIRLPDLTTPLGTHTGWNPRDPETGSPEQVMPMQGFTLWFAHTVAERNEAGDPRPSIEERYLNRDLYLEQVRSAAGELVEAGYVLPEDVMTIVEDAAARWETATAGD